MKKKTKMVKHILESLPYIEKFREKIFVVKFGGSLLEQKGLLDKFIRDITLLIHLNIKIIIVHGGGKHISKRLDKLNIKSDFKKGMRITSDKAMKEVEMVLSGYLNKKFVQCFVNENISAIGLSGKDGGLIKAKKLKSNNKVDLKNVGKIVNIDNKIINLLIDNKYLPIVSSIGYDDFGNTYNINADKVASKLAISVKAEKLIYLSDVKGIYSDFENRKKFISQLSISEAKKMIDNKLLKGGMIPKVNSCIDSINKGVNSVHMINGKIDHSVLLEIFTNKGIGTMIKGDNYDNNENV